MIAPDPNLYCERCKQPIDAETRVWLELDPRNGKYVAVGTVPPVYSQGCFPFGPDCAERANKPYARKS